MKPQKTIQRAFYVMLLLFTFGHAESQQKIQIKDGTKDVGHFSVELTHNLPGNPMKGFSGNGGTIEVSQQTNSFVLRMQNFVWYDMGETVELVFDTQEIESKSDGRVVIEQKNNLVTLKPLSSYIREIYFTVDGYGSVKLSVPFKYIGGTSQFFQEFTISPDTPEAKEAQKAEKLTSKDVRKIWKEVDRDNRSQVTTFLDEYGEENAAKKYVKIAERALSDLDAKDLLEKEKARITGKKVIKDDADVTIAAVAENGNQLDGEKLVDDVSTIVDSLDLEQQLTDELVMYNLTLIHGENADIIEIADKEMPLQLNLKVVGENEMALINAVPIPAFTRDSVVEINQELLQNNKIKGVFSSFNLVNAQGIELFNSPIILDNAPAGKNTTRYLIYCLGALLVGFGLFVFLSKRNKEKKQAETKKIFQQKLAENRKITESETQVGVGQLVVHDDVPATQEVKKNKIVIGQKVTERKKEDLVPSHSVARKPNSGSNKFRITKKRKAGIAIDYAEFVALVNAQKTVNVDLSKIWSDSRIKNVYLAPNFIKELDNFLADSSNEGIQNELQGAVPEVGGFLMGRFSEQESALQVFVEKFVAFVPEYNDVFKIEIGTKTIVDELGDAQDKNPQLEVIGWFHTHPGHGLFLSTSDLSVQRHFPADYQVAMEIDSLTKGLDMSFFTRQSTGKMNNSQDRKPGVGWFQWVDIDNSNLT